MNKYLCLLVLVVIFLLSLSVGVSSVYAQSIRRYYDWSSTLETRDNVLGIVYAQEATGAATPQPVTPPPPTSYVQFNRYLFGGNLTPESPLYFIKPVQETITLTFTFDPKAKEDIRVAIVGSRLYEMQQLADSTNTKAVVAAAVNYTAAMKTVSDNIVGLNEQNVNVDDLVKKTESETAKHNVVLEEVAARVPDQAKDAIEKALEASWKATDVSADLSGRPAVPPDLVTRIQALKAQGLLTEEETNKLIGVKSRSEARVELKKYVNEGVVPESDFLRLNENVKVFYPQEFYKIHEVKRFYELKRLETEKPDDNTISKIEEFKKTYKPGELVPSAIRRYWVPVVRLEELQNTFRPDLIDVDFFKNRDDDHKKFTEIIERLKPRPEDVAFIKTYIGKNRADVNNLPPEYQRMYHISQRYGAQCGAGSRWVPSPSVASTAYTSVGYCAPEGTTTPIDLPRTEEFARGKACSGNLTAARGPGGSCSAYPSDCIPPGWSRAATCVESPIVADEGGRPGLTCGPNTHWVPVAYMSEGGYCAPNYTSTDTRADALCPASYHRNYPGGPCMPDYTYHVSTPPLPPIGTPIYYPPYTQRCGPGAHWVPEPINPSGGYCVSDNYYPTPYTYLTPYQYPGASPYPYQTPGTYPGASPYPYQSPSIYYQSPYTGTGPCTAPPAGCGSGFYWDTGSCTCKSGSGPSPINSCQGLSCGGASWLDYSTCTCKTGTYPGASPYPYQTPGTYQTPYSYYQTPYTYSYPTPYSYQTPYYSTPSIYYATPYTYAYPTPYTYSYPTPYTYQTPYTYSYPTPYSYAYPTPYSGGYATPYSYAYPTPYSYQTPSYATPSYGTPSYPTPSYGTPSYPTPSYGTPESYSTPSYGTPVGQTQGVTRSLNPLQLLWTYFFGR